MGHSFIFNSVKQFKVAHSSYVIMKNFPRYQQQIIRTYRKQHVLNHIIKFNLSDSVLQFTTHPTTGFQLQTGWAFVSEPLSPDRIYSLMGHSGVKAVEVRTVLPGAKIFFLISPFFIVPPVLLQTISTLRSLLMACRKRHPVILLLLSSITTDWVWLLIFTRFLDHTQRRSTVGRTHLNE